MKIEPIEVGRRSTARRTSRAAFVAVCVVLVAACGSDDDSGAATSSIAPSTTAAPATEAPPATTTDATTATTDAAGTTVPADVPALADVCPANVVLQTSWFPEAEHGAAYQLAGTNGTHDAGSGVYRGEMGDTGVTFEVRAGGPFLGGQPVQSILYQDDDVLFGYMSTLPAIANYADTPTVGVFVPYDLALDSVIYDQDTIQMEHLSDMAATGAPLMSLENNRSILELFVSQDTITEDQLDFSYDGSLSRFVTADGANMLLGYATNEPYRLEHETEQWMKPVSYLPLADAGFEGYSAAWAVTPEKLESEADCLEVIVPMIQQAQLDYYADPASTNELIARLVAEQNTFWTMSAGHLEYSTNEMIENFTGNGNDDTFGNFDLDRIDRVIASMKDVFAAQGIDIPDDLSADSLVTNEFVDPAISWTAP